MDIFLQGHHPIRLACHSCSNERWTNWLQLQPLKIKYFHHVLFQRTSPGIFIGVCISTCFSNGTEVVHTSNCGAYPRFCVCYITGGCRIGFCPVIIEFRNPPPCMQLAIYSFFLVDCSDLIFFSYEGFIPLPYLHRWKTRDGLSCRQAQFYRLRNRRNSLLSFGMNCLCTGHAKAAHIRGDKKVFLNLTGVLRKLFPLTFATGVSL